MKKTDSNSPQGGILNASDIVRDISSVDAGNGTGFNRLIDNMTLIGGIKDAIAQICRCRVQIRLIETEKLRIREEAKCLKSHIDAHTRIALKALGDKKSAFESALEHSEALVNSARTNSMKTSEILTQMTQLAFSNDIGPQERIVCLAEIRELSRDLVSHTREVGKAAEQIFCTTRVFLEQDADKLSPDDMKKLITD